MSCLGRRGAGVVVWAARVEASGCCPVSAAFVVRAGSGTTRASEGVSQGIAWGLEEREVSGGCTRIVRVLWRVLTLADAERVDDGLEY